MTGSCVVTGWLLLKGRTNAGTANLKAACQSMVFTKLSFVAVDTRISVIMQMHITDNTLKTKIKVEKERDLDPSGRGQPPGTTPKIAFIKPTPFFFTCLTVRHNNPSIHPG